LRGGGFRIPKFAWHCDHCGLIFESMRQIADRAGRTPKYLPLYDELRERIESGELGVGAFLPREDLLCSQYETTLYAVREALSLLERQGYIERRRRAGTRVVARVPSSIFRHAVGSRRDLLQLTAETSITYTAPRLVETDGKLARFLGCDEGRRWYLIEGVRRDAQGLPIGITRVHIDASRTTVPPKADFGHQPVYEWVERTYDIRATIVSQDISAVAFTAEEATVFGQSAGSPALRIVRRYFDDKQRIFQISVNTHRSETFVYNLRISFEQ